MDDLLKLIYSNELRELDTSIHQRSSVIKHYPITPPLLKNWRPIRLKSTSTSISIKELNL